jgi:2-methylisocitrate lyase-like PEP mutase family enzyme
VLPNAWDPASAVVIEAAGATAVATTSAGISWACGALDGERLTRDRMLQALSEIAGAVSVPVTADIESGYAATLDELAVTIDAVLRIGVVGINIEDRPGTGGPLRDPSVQAARIRAARATANRAGSPLWINARTDTFLAGSESSDALLSQTMARASIYMAAGADSLFVPGVTDMAVIEALVKGPLPINVMAGPGSPDIPALAQAGVARVSIGPAIAAAAYGLVGLAAAELLRDGTYTSMNGGLDYGRMNELLQPPS